MYGPEAVFSASMRREMAAILVAAGACALLGASSARAAGPPGSCAWLRLQAVDRLNVESPESAASYWVAPVAVPPGGAALVRGRFPHSRYLSFHTYTATGLPIDALADVDIAPDPGSTNPFGPGADRTATARDYTVRVVNGRVPPQRAPNTLYTESADGTRSSLANVALLELRVFVPDRGRDRTGDAGLPRLAGLPDCPRGPLDDLGLEDPLARLGGPSTLPAGGSGLGGQNPPTWTRFTTITRSVVKGLLDNRRTGSTLYPLADALAARLPSVGFLENLNTAYVFTFFTTGYGDVLAFRARAPTTPHTLAGEPTMGTGQVRYWSMCTGTPLTTTLGCVEDEQVPLDAGGNYTIVVSPAGARPANATPACGVAWLPAGPLPSAPVILRNMLADPGFAQATRNAKPGTEAQTMGPYYPRGTYYARKADFERLGCPVSSPVPAAP
jgi:hypothetical protein